MNLGFILIVILIVLLIVGLPTWPYSRSWGYGYYPSSAVFVILIVLIIILLLGHRF